MKASITQSLKAVLNSIQLEIDRLNLAIKNMDESSSFIKDLVDRLTSKMMQIHLLKEAIDKLEIQE